MLKSMQWLCCAALLTLGSVGCASGPELAPEYVETAAGGAASEYLAQVSDETPGIDWTEIGISAGIALSGLLGLNVRRNATRRRVWPSER